MMPKSIAVVGASPKGNRGSKILSNLSRFQFPGRVYVINPRYDEVQGFPCYPDVSALPETVDFAAFALPADAALSQIELFGKAGTRSGLIIGGGFGEGDGNHAQRATLEALCQEYDMRLCGPNCYGILNVHGRVAAYSGEIVDPLIPGNVAFIIHSGALSHALHNTSIGRGVGISHIITSGNEISVEMGDYLEWLVDDPNATVIALFIEGLKKSERFIRAAEKALDLGKPIVVLKVGRSERGKSSAVAHTGSVAGDDAVYDGLFRRLGIIRVDDIDELREMLVLLSHKQPLTKSSFALSSISGGITTLLADLSEEVHLDVPELGPETGSKLSSLLPPFATVSNPLDTTGQLFENPDLLEPIADCLLADDRIGGFAVALNTPYGNTNHVARCAALARAQERTKKPIVCFSVSSAGVDSNLVNALGGAGIPFLLGARETVRSLKRWGWYVDARRRRANDAPVPRAPIAGVAHDFKQIAIGQGQLIVTEERAIRILSAYGVPFARQRLVRSVDEAVRAASELGYPVAAKIDIEGIAHKSELRGIRLGIGDERELRSAYADLTERVGQQLPQKALNGITIQKMVPSGLEVLLGARADPIFGPQVVVGPGGVLVEIIKDVAVRGAPLTVRDAEEMISETVLGRLIGGYRGGPPFDRRALIDAILAVSAAAVDLRDSLQEIDVNPLIVMPDGEGALAVDAVIALHGAARTVR